MKLATEFLLICSVFVFILLNLPAHSFAEKWILFYNSQDEEKYYFDRESVERPDKKIIRVWQKKTNVVKGQEEEMEKIQVEIDCNKKTYKIIKDETKDFKDIPSEKIKPSSRMEVLLDNVCYIK